MIEYSIKIYFVNHILTRAETNIPNIRSFPNEYLFTTYGQLHDFVYIGGIENIYSYLNCLLLANTLCSYEYIIVTLTRKLFSTVFGILKLN